MSNINNHGDNNIINNAGGDIYQTVLTKETKINTTGDLLSAAKNAQLIIKIIEVREQYYEAEWTERKNILSTLQKYRSQTNYHLAKELYSFLADVVECNRGRLPQDIASTVFSLVIDYFPNLQDEVEKTTELLYQFCDIGFNITYDNSVYAGDFTTVMYGLLVLKLAVLRGKENGSKPALDRVKKVYSELERNLSLDHDKDYLELIGFFKADLPTRLLQFPMLSDNLMRLIYPERY